MKTVIVYASKHGATKLYAEWLAKELEANCYSIEDVKVSQLKADNIILGSAIYMGHLRIADWLLDYWHHFSDKHVALFSVSGTDTDNPELDAMIAKSMPEHYLKKMKIFKMPGRIEKDKLAWWEKLIVDLVIYFEKDPDRKRRFEEGVDNIHREKLKELHQWLHEIETPSAEK